MIREYKTIRDATELFVSEMNAIPTDFVRTLMNINPDEWVEKTKPRRGDLVYVLDLPDGCESNEYYGKIVRRHDNEIVVKLNNGIEIVTDETNVDIQREDIVPVWGTMWSFGDKIDEYWLEERDGLHLMSDCGFRIYENEDYGYFFGIDGAGYDFFEQHWIPLYKARGLKWHDDADENYEEV